MASDSGNKLPEGYEITGRRDELVTVKATCAGCGEAVFEEEMFEDQLCQMAGTPVHDSISCMEEARDE